MTTLAGLLRYHALRTHEKWYSRRQRRYDLDLSFTEAVDRFANRNELHAYFHHNYHQMCLEEVRAHRTYFKQFGRGFGEDAFHAMWATLLREFRPKKCVEIGVFRGQTISLWALIARLEHFACEIHGISPFAPVGDVVSNYPKDIDYIADVRNAFDLLNLPAPTLIRSLSTDPIGVEHLKSTSWDLIYIDGSHDYEIVLSDYRISLGQLKIGGLLVMDDSSLYTTFKPPPFSFAGHPGPSRVMSEMAMKELRFLGAVGHNNEFIRAPTD